MIETVLSKNRVAGDSDKVKTERWYKKKMLGTRRLIPIRLRRCQTYGIFIANTRHALENQPAAHSFDPSRAGLKATASIKIWGCRRGNKKGPEAIPSSGPELCETLSL